MSDAENKAVFLSYASQDAEAAKRIAEALRASGGEVWFDQNELVGGDAWDQKIRGQIKSCALFVPVISAATQARREGYFRLEWKLAAQRTHTMADGTPFLLPVVIDATKDGEALVPEEFRAVQWTRLPGGEGAAVEKFCARVGKLLGGSDVARAFQPVSAPMPDTGWKARATLSKPARGWSKSAIVCLGLLVAIVAYLALRPRRSPEEIAKLITSAETSSATAATKSTAATAPLTEARKLVAKVWELLNQPGMARAELDTADLLCKRAASLDPTDAEVWAAWAQTDVAYVWNVLDASKARREAAREHAARAMQLDPRSYEARLAQAAYLAHGRTAIESRPVSPEAEVLLRELLRERPGEPRAALELFILVWTDEAFSLLESVAKNHPAFAARALNELAWRLYFTDRFAEADAMADRSIAVHPYWNNLGLKIVFALYWHGDVELAKATLRRMPTSALQEDWAAFLGCRVYTWREEYADGLAALSGIPRDWLSTGLYSGPKALLAADLHRRAGQAELARREYQRALSQLDARLVDEPNDTALLAKKAEALFYLDRRADADACYRLLRETGLPPPLQLQILFEPPEVALATLEEGVLKLNNNGATFSAAALRLSPFYAPLRGHPRFAALLAQAEADPKRSPNAKASKSILPVPDAKSVAVLAFKNLGGDPSREFFSDAMSDAVTDVLGRVPGLKVVGSASAFSFKGKSVPIPEIARQLGVTHLVEGTVLQEGQTVRVTAKLIQADGFQVGPPEQVYHELKNIFTLHAEVAGLIAKNLSLKLGVSSAAATATVDPEAYQLYLAARQAFNLSTPEGVNRAEELLSRALALAPGLARAHAALSDVRRNQAQGARTAGALSQRNSPAMLSILAAAKQAVALDPDLPEARVALGAAHWMAWNIDEAKRELVQAMALNPNYAAGHHLMARVWETDGRIDEALAEYQRAVELDPLFSRLADNYSQSLVCAGRLEEALIYADRALTLQPENMQALGLKASTLARLGRSVEAMALARTLESRGGYAASWAANTFALAGDRAAAERVLKQRPLSSIDPITLGALGRHDEVIASIQSGMLSANISAGIYYFPTFDPIRQDPRFLKALADSGATEAHARAQAWRKAHPPEKPVK